MLSYKTQSAGPDTRCPGFRPRRCAGLRPSSGSPTSSATPGPCLRHMSTHREDAQPLQHSATAHEPGLYAKLNAALSTTTCHHVRRVMIAKLVMVMVPSEFDR